MLAAALLVALTPDVAIVESPARARAGRNVRFHVTLLHAGAGMPEATSIDFGDGTVRRLRYAAVSQARVFDAVAAHAFARPGRFTIAVRSASGRLLAGEYVDVSPAPTAPAAPAVPAASDGRAPLAVPGGPGAPVDPTRSGILVTPEIPPPPATDAPPAESLVAPAGTATPAVPARRATIAPGGPAAVPTPLPTETPAPDDGRPVRR